MGLVCQPRPWKIVFEANGLFTWVIPISSRGASVERGPFSFLCGRDAADAQVRAVTVACSGPLRGEVLGPHRPREICLGYAAKAVATEAPICGRLPIGRLWTCQPLV